MKTRIFVVLLSAIIVCGFIALPVFAQETSCCGSTEVEGCAGCSAGCQEKAVQTAETPNQEKCPVMGSPVNKEVYTDYNGKRVYFCCAGCDKKFRQDPEKYMKQMKEKGVVLENVHCPVSGKPANPEVFTEYQGKKVYFCCEGCKEKFLASPEKYLKK
ncbi:MAG: YHS domain-containing protein [bacterium]